MPAPAFGVASNSAHSLAKESATDGAPCVVGANSLRMGEALTIRRSRFSQAAATIVVATLICCFANAQPATGATVQGSAAQGDRPKAPGNGSGGAPSAAGAVEPPPDPSRTHVYLFRGALGLIFSRGMDKLATQIQRIGATANVYEFTVCSLISSTAIEEYKSNPFPIILMGHSMGGRCALQFAERLKDEGIPVELVVTIDPAHLSPSVPTNVARFINIFLSKDWLGGGDIKPVEGFKGHYASYDLQQHGELHVNIDKVDDIHQQIAAKVAEVALASAKSEGEILPLHYAVPAKADVELWDSGTAITARLGDTLQTLAAQYQLPLWALAQANHLPDNTPLGAGQRVIVPRHLVVSAIASEPISSKR